VLHEYAHHLEYMGGYTPWSDGVHGLRTPASTDTLAWSEGWGDFFGALHGGNPFTLDYGIYRDNGLAPGGTVVGLAAYLEPDSAVKFSPNLNTVSWTQNYLGRGPRWEFSIAGALWDLYDSSNDKPPGAQFGDSLSDGFANIWNCLHSGTRFDSVGAFLGTYEGLYANPKVDFRRTTLLRRIFLDHGIYAGRDTAFVTGIEDAPALAPGIQFLGARPNPFNPITRIRFSVGGRKLPGPAVVRVFDAQGRLVRTLRPAHTTLGVNEVVWDGNSGTGLPLASGIYFCEFESGTYRDRAKLAIIR